ncbi:protein commissureless 2 homolog [Ochlerotatus camptorhynchus]|uniref:protein commissureless 2 homolog n=1 Tax=Ochlerotatus camptorhynchus TaxID=644619 RepID=UPI0031D82411
MLDTMESRITFEVPSNLDFDKLIRDNNYTLFWQNLHSEPYRSKESGRVLVENPVQGDRNSSDFSLMSSLKHFAGARGGVDGWGLALGSGGGGGGGYGESQIEGPLVDPSMLWIGAVMVLLILSGLFCVCSCYLYYKYRRWQKCVSMATCQTMASMDIEAPPAYDIETLPSYTIASGLPSYEDAVRHLTRQHQQTRDGYEPAAAARKSSPAYSNNSIHPPSVAKFFESRPQNWLNVTIFEEIHYNFVGRGTAVDASAATTVPATSSAGLLSDPTTKREAISGWSDDIKSDSDSGLFKVQICMVENEKIQSSHR